MLAKIKKLPRYLAKTAALFSLFFLIGCLLSMLIKATPGEGNLTRSSFENLKTIALKNCLLIVTVYISVIFTKVYGYGVLHQWAYLRPNLRLDCADKYPAVIAAPSPWHI